IRRVLAAQSKSTEFFYDARNRAEAVALLVRISGQKADDVEKAYDFFHKNNFFDRTGKISRVKLNALIDALVGWATCRRAATSSGFCCPAWRSCRTDRG